ncbi:Ubinuclein conserved middle domain [Popillia japonica]|uniref:Ubinuclein conserved middle domain n=1 Tax=Popillia japonica TaxID=7064 RepID=A0AAW1IYT8_POPJA
MSDIKRPALISFSAHKADDKKSKENAKTIRITLALPESNEDTCPEYNYKEELAAAKRKDKIKHIKPTTNGLDPFNDDDDDVRRIAQEMEAKYGAAGPKKRRKGRRDDYADIGMGYDESDSFIDNTDGYDEIIPQNVTTLHGGFYINSGALEFKTDDEASSEISSSSSSEDEEGAEGEVAKGGVKKKRVLDSTSETEGEKETDKDINHLDKKPKIHTNGLEEEIKPKSKLLTPEKIKQLKKKRTEERKKNTVKELLDEKRDSENNQLPSVVVKSVDVKDELKESMKENKKPHSADNISDIIESVVKGVDEDLKKQDRVDVKPPSHPEKGIPIPTSEGENSPDVDDKKIEYEIVKLPENLPNDIVDIIEKIKECIRENTEGKLVSFSGPIGDYLLKLERKCKCLGRQSRMKIYEHLTPFTKCRKEILIKQTKSLVFDDDQRRLRQLVNKLKDEIDRFMPSLLDNYEKESQKVMQKKFSKESLANEEHKHLRMPKRRFAWTEDIKKLLKEIVVLRKRCFLSEGKNKDNLDLLICTYLKTEIQILWPEGWMSINTLQKACNMSSSSESKKSNHHSHSSSSSASSHNVKSSSSSREVTPSVEISHVREIQKLTSNSNLSITPVTNVPQQKSVNTNNVDSVKSRSIESKDLTTSSKNSNNKTLPDVMKSSNSLTITPTSTVTMKTCSERMKRIDFIEPNKENDLVVVEEKHGKHHNENNNLHHSKSKESSSHGKSESSGKTDSGHCQIIDLTDTLLTSDIKKKSSHKIKSKSYDSEKGPIRVKTDLMKPKPDKDEITAKVCEDLTQLFQQNMSRASSSCSSSSISPHGKPKDTSQYSPFSTTPPLEFQKIKQPPENDDIHKAMENLKVLQRLSSPAKSNETLTSSPVSVIAYNKSYSPKSVLQNAGSSSQNAPNVSVRNDYKADYGSGFQEVFQRQFLNDFTLMQNSVNHSAPTSSKSHYNSSEKYQHTAESYLNEKYYPNSNNNFSQQSAKMKNLTSQQSAGHIPKQPQK